MALFKGEKTMPPIGVKPEAVWLGMRINELSLAIGRYADCPGARSISLRNKWAAELRRRIFDLEGLPKADDYRERLLAVKKLGKVIVLKVPEGVEVNGVPQPVTLDGFRKALGVGCTCTARDALRLAIDSARLLDLDAMSDAEKNMEYTGALQDVAGEDC